MRTRPTLWRAAIRSALTASIVLAPTLALAQFPLFGAAGSVTDGRFGSVIVPCGDLDGDGIPDLAIGAPTGAGDQPDQPASLVLAGRVRAIAADGGTIFEWLGSQPGDAFGFAIAAIGDVDLDGTPDLAVGAPRASSEFDPSSGRIAVYSTKSGTMLWQSFGSDPHDYVGAATCQLGDLNLDGRPDFLVGTPFADANGKDSGRARIHAGHNGAILKTHNGASALDRLGLALCALGDVTFDGQPDYALGAPNALVTTGIRGGRVTLHSSTGALLGKLEGIADGDGTGSTLSPIPDVSGDNRGDLLVGEPGATATAIGSGRVRCISGGNGAVLVSASGTAADDRFGTRVIGLSDFDADGIPDWLAANAGLGGSIRSGATGAALAPVSPGAGIRGVAPTIDYDGDGVIDLAIGFPTAPIGPQDAAGRVEIWPGPTAMPSVRFSAANPIVVETSPGAAKVDAVRSIVGAGLPPAIALLAAEPKAGWISTLHVPTTPLVYGETAPVEIEIDPSALLGPLGEATLELTAADSILTDSCAIVVSAPSPLGEPQLALDSRGPWVAAQDVGGVAPPPFVVRVSNSGNTDYALAFEVSFEPPVSWAHASMTSGMLAAHAAAPIEIAVALDAAGATGVLSTTLVVRDVATGAAETIPIALLAGYREFAPGDVIRGEIADALDLDVIRVDAVAGMIVELKMLDAPTGLTISWLDFDGSVVASSSPKAGKNWKESFVIERDGPWRVAVSGLATTGYEIRTKLKKLPKAAKTRSFALAGDALDTPGFALGTLHGATVTVTAKAKPAVTAALAVQLTLSTGATMDVSPFTTSSTGGLAVGAVPVSIVGTHRFEFDGLAPNKSLAVKVTISLPPKGSAVVDID